MEYHQRWGLRMSEPNLLTLFVSAFLHADWKHLLSNLLMLWIVGTVLEAGIGSMLFSLLYCASMVSAALLQGLIIHFFDPGGGDIPMIGASGAIAGIVGFATVRYYHIRVLNFFLVPNITGLFVQYIPAIIIPLPLWVPFWVYAVYWGGKEFIIGLLQLQPGGGDGVAHWAHLGGMAIGLLAGLLLNSFQEGRREFAIENSTKSTPKKARSYEELQHLLRKEPNDPELLEAMAGVLLTHGDLEASRRMYLRAIPLFLQRNLGTRAAISYLNLLRSDPQLCFAPPEQLTLAAALETMGHYPEAAQGFELLAQQHIYSAEAETALVRAAQLYSRYLKNRKRAGTLLQELLTNYPESPWRDIARERLRDIERQQLEDQPLSS